MKIAIEAQRLFRKKKHGMDIVALELIKNLQLIDKINEYHIFVKDDVDKNCIDLKDNFYLHVLPSLPYPIWEQLTLPKAVKACGAEVLHCTGNTAPFFVSCPTVITLHDIIYLENNPLSKGSTYQKFGNLYRKWIVPSVVKKAKIVVTVSDFERNTILRRLHQLFTKLKVVYNGVGDHFNKKYGNDELQQVRTEYSLPDPFILFLGNTAPKKNLENVVKAFSEFIKNSKNSIQLVIVDFSKDNLMKVLKQNNIDESILSNICLPGYVKNGDLPAFYGLAKVFLYPSLRESFGIPILESMACGTPVITSNTSSMPEVAGDAAILVDPFDYKAIVSALNQLLDRESLQNDLIVRGHKRAKDFTWQNTAINMLEIYKSVKVVSR